MLFRLTSYGQLLCQIWGSVFYRRSWSIFLLLAQGWALSQISHTVAEYIWLSGGSKDRHFSRYYVFLSDTLYPRLEELWLRFYRWLDSWLAADVSMLVLLDDTTRKKSGPHIEGISNYKNQAGSARQEYRVLRGLNFVCLSLRLQWRGYLLSLPLGCEIYLKPEVARELGREHQSRSALARQRIKWLVKAMPNRAILVCCDGGYATKEMMRDLPPTLTLITRLLVSGSIYEPPCPVAAMGKRGPKPQKGAKLPPPKEWPTFYQDWQPHPTEAHALIRTAVLRWPKSYPRKNLRVVVVWRPNLSQSQHPRDQKRFVEAFISTDIHHSPEYILTTYQDRWAIEIEIRDAYAYYGLGKDKCRKLPTLEAINNFRLMMAAARTCWFINTFEKQDLDLTYLRPWYTKKKHPSQADIAIACQEALQCQGIKPIPRFFTPHTLFLNHTHHNQQSSMEARIT